MIQNWKSISIMMNKSAGSAKTQCDHLKTGLQKCCHIRIGMKIFKASETIQQWKRSRLPLGFEFYFYSHFKSHKKSCLSSCRFSTATWRPKVWTALARHQFHIKIISVKICFTDAAAHFIAEYSRLFAKTSENRFNQLRHDYSLGKKNKQKRTEKRLKISGTADVY